MTVNFRKLFMIAVALLLMIVPLAGHHGTFVSYDSDHPITMKAIVTEFRYTNPHIQLYFDVKDDKGEITHWSAEGPDPAVLDQPAWARNRSLVPLSPAREIRITATP